MKRFEIFGLIALLLISALLIAACGEAAINVKTETDTEDAVEFEPIDKETNDTEAQTDAPDTEEPTDTEDAETKPPETEEDDKKDTEEQDIPASPDSSETGLAALALANKLIGTEYKLGGVGPDEFDNSGFIYYIFKECGVAVPRLARDMPLFGKTVARADIAPGDILVFANEIGGDAEFVAIYAGDGQFIACFNPDKPTQQAPIGNDWEARFITARRAY